MESVQDGSWWWWKWRLRWSCGGRSRKPLSRGNWIWSGEDAVVHEAGCWAMLDSWAVGTVFSFRRSPCWSRRVLKQVGLWSFDYSSTHWKEVVGSWTVSCSLFLLPILKIQSTGRFFCLGETRFSQDRRAVDNMATEEMDWQMITRLGLGYSFPVGWSEETTAASPEKATWHHPEEGYVIEWEVVDASEGLSSGPGWTDPAFPPDSFSLGDPAGEMYKNPVWIRACDLAKDPVLFGELEPADALQGSMGNCGMVAALACLAEFPGFLSSCFLTKELPEDGKYQVRMHLPLNFEHNKTEKKWETVEIDDYLPCHPPAKEGVLTSARLMFCKLANGNKLYMSATSVFGSTFCIQILQLRVFVPILFDFYRDLISSGGFNLSSRPVHCWPFMDSSLK